MAIIRFGSSLFGITEDPIFGKFNPMVPILIPMAFTGELVYRMEFFAEGIGNFLPTIGTTVLFSLSLEKTAFVIPVFPVQMLSSFLMLNGAIAGCYILWRFCLEDFEGLVELNKFIGLNLLIILQLLAYLVVIF